MNSCPEYLPCTKFSAMKPFATLVTLLMTLSFLNAQPKSIFTNAKPIDESRYKAYKGSPYFFDDWVLADIYDANGKAFEQLEMNFNGYTNEIEIRKGNQYIELDKKWYSKIEANSPDGIITFVQEAHSHFKNNFVEAVYIGNRISLVRKFRIALTEKEINDVGKTIKIKRFEKRLEYYFIKGEKLNNIKWKKKSILSYLGHKKDIEAFLKKNKLKLTSDKGIQKVLAFYEEQENSIRK